MSGPTIKCLVWDLDDTVWEGILLEGGGRRLRPGVPETVRELDRRGILQSIASRNHHEAAMERLRELGNAPIQFLSHYGVFFPYSDRKIDVTGIVLDNS